MILIYAHITNNESASHKSIACELHFERAKFLGSKVSWEQDGSEFLWLLNHKGIAFAIPMYNIREEDGAMLDLHKKIWRSTGKEFVTSTLR